MLTSKSRHNSIRPGSFAVEILESRFLLAAGDLSALVVGTEQLVSGSQVDAVSRPAGSEGAAPTAAITTTTTAGATTATPAPGGTTDTYRLKAGAGEPAVQVELRWSSGLDPADGTLVVLDATGSILYQFALDQVAELEVTLTIPLPQGSSASDLLDLDLKVQRGTAGADDPGSYDLTLGWKAVTAPSRLGPATTLGGGPSEGVGPPPPSPPSLSIIGQPLPIAVAPPPGTGTTGGMRDGSGQDGSGDASSSGHGEVPGGPTGPAVPVPVHPLPVANLPVASAPISAVSSSPAADRGSALVVGPLPLGRSTPDGGIFERSFTAVVPFALEEPFPAKGMTGAVLASSTPTPPITADQMTWTAVPAVVRQEQLARFLRAGRSSAGRSGSSRPGDGETTSDPAAVGAAFLPPVVVGALAAQEAPVWPGIEARPARSRGARWNPVAAALFALAGSAALVLKLNGPEWLRSLRS